MPPVYPFILAALLKVLPSKMMVALVVVFLKNIVLIITGLFLYEIAKKTRLRLPASVVLVLYCMWLLCNFRWFFQITHDEWLLLMVMKLYLQWLYIYGSSDKPQNSNCMGRGRRGCDAYQSDCRLVWLVLTLALVRST